MPNGDKIIDELEFREHYRNMPAEEREMWLPKEVFFISQTLKTLSDCEKEVERRLNIVESNCIHCQDTPTGKGLDKKQFVVAGGGVATGMAVIYAVLELLGKLQ